ncbi:MAG: ABC transporter permease [Firmicutes bacterium]|nr:ABC transporter permease [Bacillota bacterium]
MLKIAWRNVLRNKRRSLLSLLIISIGVAVLFLVNGYIRATFEGLKYMAVSQYGNLQIAAGNFWDNDNQRHLLSKTDLEKVERLLASRPEVQSYTRVLGVNGIIGTEKNSTVIAGSGIEPGNDQGQNIMITSGINLFPDDIDKVLLGKGVMQKLGVEEGEWVSLMTTTLDGAYNAGSLQVSGSFTAGNSEADNVYINLPVSYAQSLLNTEGVDKVVVGLEEIKDTDSTAVWLREQFSNNGLDLEIKTWFDLAEYYKQVRGLYEIIFHFMAVVIFFLVLTSVLEIMSMAFFERMNEIGTIRSIGTKRHQIFSLLTMEGMITGITGGFIGLLAGYGVGRFINQLHLTYSAPSLSEPAPLSFDLSLANGMFPFVIVVSATLVSAFYPAFKASRLNIVEILRHK